MKLSKWNEGWKFWDSKDAFALVWDVPENAREVTLPHDAMIELAAHADAVNGGNTGFYDGGSYTYVKMFTSHPGDREKTILLKFEGIYMNAFVYVNGQLAANRPYGYAEFYVPIHHLLKEEGENEIRIQVRNGAQSSRWYTGSGIYRDVYLLEGGDTTVKENSLQIRTLDCDSEDATIQVEGVCRYKGAAPKEIYVQLEVLNRENRVVETDYQVLSMLSQDETGVCMRMNLSKPKLWSEDTPYLYRAHMALYTVEQDAQGYAKAGQLLDETEETFGIRKLQLDARHGLRVNGVAVKLRGGCLHHDSGILGARTYEDAEYRRVQIMKEAGFNAIRMSHHPAAPALLKACDELGMYVMDEGFDMWTRCKSDYDYNLYFQDWWKRDLEAMIRKDYNHPSVILYSIGNEIPEIGTDAGARLAREMSALCHTLDSSRYTLAAINGVFAAGDAVPQITADIVGEVQDRDDSVNVNDFMTIMDKYMDKIVVHPEITKRLEKACSGTDIAGYNYMTARYGLDVREHPNRILVGSETYPPEIATNWEEVMKYPQVLGDFTWTGWDYIGEAGVGIPAYRWGEGGFGAQYPAKLAYSGDMDITGFRRPASYYRQIVFGLRKDPYIAVQDPHHYGETLMKTPWVISDAISSWSWNGCQNQPVMVEVYSPGDEVELFLNGKSMGRKPAGAKEKYRTLFDVTYIPGEVRAVAYEKGAVLGEYTLKTAGTCDKLSVTFDPYMRQDSQLVYVDVALTDLEGNVCTDRKEKMSVEVLSGDAQLLGFGSADPKAQDIYGEPQTTTWNGRAQAIFQIKPENEAKICVRTEDGKSATLKI